MSLSDDFGMYYNNTYVGYNHPTLGLLPLNIEGVGHDSSVMNLREMSSSERETIGFSDAALDALTFHGTFYDPNQGTYVTEVIPYNSSRLVLDLPDPKFIKWRNQYYWVSYRANRSTKKGITHRRMAGMPAFDWNILAEFFKTQPVEGVRGGVYLQVGTDLRYKDVYIGTISGSSIELFAEAAHLLRSVTREFPECQVLVQPH